MIAAMIVLESYGVEELYLQVTVGRYSLTVGDCAGQAGHNNFEVREGGSPACLVLASESKILCLLAFSAL